MNIFEYSAENLIKEQLMSKLEYKQILNHYFVKNSVDVLNFSDIKKERRIDLAKFFPECLKLVNKQISKIDGTTKYLWQLNDGLFIESVLMFYDKRVTVCVSSQVGCKMACDFCATGKLGFTRNLTVYEILEQIRYALIEANNKKLPLNIVFMGMGEPTDNFDNVKKVLELITNKNPLGFAIPSKNITISTVGDIKGINKFTNINIDFKMAFSLHSSNNDVRDKLIPLNKVYNIDGVIDSLYNYYLKKKVRVSIEYAMIKNLNDDEKQAYKLAKILNRKGSNWAHVNLIELNEIDESPFLPSSKEAVQKFVEILKSKNIIATIRRSRGQDIDGACGQLAGAQKTLRGV